MQFFPTSVWTISTQNLKVRATIDIQQFSVKKNILYFWNLLMLQQNNGTWRSSDHLDSSLQMDRRGEEREPELVQFYLEAQKNQCHIFSEVTQLSEK